ncbi:methylated-DNA--[protein]-cysteine S-methyltransferase [Geomesophilobacter sediminis]|uniref:Methylated-DNA--protein-cysteine methyltransferase n=1 Tax=Geomesophilobacter sediminis TaxID=2798584 RepID=A0A8J7S7B1_9BACT|nr:methylated-DNA--[protein]-cysteine S-methyltransferase [Geomesophilobacter sediminis]MBJ6726847.1 methylated-DNA--[protein]-cysteine S-methyltransferase [Geomesophilobacter sediminis]
MIYTCTIDTPLGAMTAAAEDGAVIGLWFVGQKYYPRQTEDWIVDPAHPALAALRDELDRYFAGARFSGAVRLAPKGSVFQKAVWEVLAGIPYGETMTYGEIARTIAGSRGMDSMSAQAVGGAVGHNPISIIIPCHRVMGCGGKLTGYAGGVERKEALLRLEGNVCS